MRHCFLLCLYTAFFLIGDSNSKIVPVGPCVLVEEEPGDCPDPEYIKLYLFTRKNKKEGQYIEISQRSDNITSSNFNPLHSNKLIIHGYNSDMFMYALEDIKAEYLRQAETNIWMVNYPKLAQGSSICYPFAVHNIRHVGKCLAQLITALRRHSSPDIHVVGFSLGAQVANYISNSLPKPKLDRITGLDPAGPLFMGRSKRHRLDPSDAKFVDVVHTNGFIQGDIERSGHIDFYMNGGVSQPGCANETSPFGCDHHRAPEYFAESINTKTEFLGWRCEDYVNYLIGECKPNLNLVPMGEKCTPGNAGFYITYTAADPPYALGNWTDNTYRKRAPKMSFTKWPKNITNAFVVKQQSEILHRIFPDVVMT